MCAPGTVAYRNLLEEDEHGALLSLLQPDSDNPPAAHLTARLPYRATGPRKHPLVVACTAYHDRKRRAFFLLGTEDGDLVKAELAWEPDRGATGLKLFYFDTLPAPPLAMCIFRSGFLAVAVEGADALLLKFREVDVPEDNPAGGFSRADGGKAEVEKANGAGGLRANGEATGVDVADRAFEGEGANLAGRLQFRPSRRLSRLMVAEVIDSFGPILSMVALAGRRVGDASALVCATGKRGGGSVRMVRRGMGVLEMSQPNELRARVTQVFSCKESAESLYHRLIVVAFEKKTKVLEVGDDKLDETVSSGFELAERTLAAGQIGADSFVQVTAARVRFVRGGDVTATSEWTPPVPAVVLAACCNQQQVVAVLSTGTIVYFEVDASTGSLEELGKRADALQLPEEVDWTGGGVDQVGTPVVAIPDIPPGRKRSRFFAAGDGVSVKVRIFEIVDQGSIEPLGLSLAPAPIESIAFVDFGCVDKEAITAAVGTSKTLSNLTSYEPCLTLVIGTRHGALVRLAVDALTGTLSNKRSHFLGEKPVRVTKITISGVPTCLLMGSSAWLLFLRGGRATMSPLSTDPMEHAAAFALEQSPDGFAVTHGSRLRLLSLESVSALITSACLPHGLSVAAVPSSTVLDSSFTVGQSRTDATPRKIIHIPPLKPSLSSHSAQDVPNNPSRRELFAIVETDYLPWVEGERSSQWTSCLRLARVGGNGDAKAEEESEDEAGFEGTNPYSSVRPAAFDTLDTVKMDDADCVLAAASPADLGGNTTDRNRYIVASVASNFEVFGTGPKVPKKPRSDRNKKKAKPDATFTLRVYQVDFVSKRLKFVHKTMVPEAVHCLIGFRDMLLVGIGTTLRLYDLGKQQLLRKGEYKLAVRNKISALSVSGGDRVFVGDVSDSVTLFKYEASSGLAHKRVDGSATTRRGGHFVAVACDSVPRWIVCLEALDYNTVCASDKFGNIFVLRVPKEVSDVAGDASGGGAGANRPARAGPGAVAAHNLAVEASFHVGSMACSLVRGSLSMRTTAAGGGDGDGGRDEAVIYATMSGTVGVLAPLRTQHDIDFVRALEKEVRARCRSVCGRDHVAYRSLFYPVRHVVDGGLCQAFTGMPAAEREECAKALGWAVEDVEKKLEELQAAYV